MKKILTLALVLAIALLSTRSNRVPKEVKRPNDAQSGRAFDLAKTSDGRLDLSILLAFPRFPDDVKLAFLDADEDKDGFLSSSELTIARNIINAKAPDEDQNSTSIASNREIADANYNPYIAPYASDKKFNSEVSWPPQPHQGDMGNPRHKQPRFREQPGFTPKNDSHESRIPMGADRMSPPNQINSSFVQI